MENKERREQKIAEEMTKIIDRLYDALGESPEVAIEAIQNKVASILEGAEQRSIERKDEQAIATQKGAAARAKTEAGVKAEQAKQRAMNGDDPEEIAKDLGLSKSGVFGIMQRENIMTRTKVVELIEMKKSNAEIEAESNWNITAIERVRKEEEERKINKREKLTEKWKKENERKKQKRSEKKTVTDENNAKKDQNFRIALAKGEPTEKIADMMGFGEIKTVYVKKSRFKLLGRKEIIGLLLEKSDEEIAAMAGLNEEYVYVITQIREEELPKIEQAKQQEEKQRIEEQEKQAEEERRDQTFRVELAKGTPRKKIAILVGLKNADSVKQKKRKEGALSRQQIVDLLPSKTDEEIANDAQIKPEYIYVITRIREEEEEKKKSKENNKDVNSSNTSNDRKTEIQHNRQEKTPTIKSQKRSIENPIEQKGTKFPPFNDKEENEFISLAQNLISIRSMAKKFNLPEEEIVVRLYEYNIFTRNEVVEWLESKSNIQIAIMGNLKDDMVVARVRVEAEERRKIEANEDGNIQEKMEEQRRREDQQFLRMARNYEELNKMETVFGINRYTITLKLKKLGFRSREEIERLIEAGNVTDEELAGENGNINSVRRIRRKVNQREKLIGSIPVEKREKIISRLSFRTPINMIAYEMKISPDSIKAVQEKWERDKEEQIPEARKRVNLKLEMIKFEGEVSKIKKGLSGTTENVIDSIQYMMDRMLVLYEKILTPAHYACMAYSYMKRGKYKEGIEFAEEYLNLQESSISGVIAICNQILGIEKENGENSNISRNIRKEIMEFSGIGE